MKDNRRKCPYCDYDIKYMQLWKWRDKEYVICDNCGKRSKMLFLTNIRNNSIFAIVLSLIILLIFIIIDGVKLWSIFLVLLPFVFFYLSCPFFIFLDEMKQPPTEKKKLERQQEDLYLSKDYYDDEYKDHTLQYDVSSVKSKFDDISSDYILSDEDEYDMNATRRIDDLFLDDIDRDF